MNYRKLILVVLALGILQGCIKYKVVGSFDDYNEVVMGDIDANLLSGTGHIVAEGKNFGIKCEGDSYVTYIPPSLSCVGQRGRAPIRCSDGRRVEAEWVATSCSTGYGEGIDQKGARFRFVFGLDEKSAQEELAKKSQEVSEKPEFPVYRPREVRKEKGFASGTGFFVTDDGVIITNYHVIEGAKEILAIYPSEKKEFIATLLSVDPANDVAILRINAQTIAAPLASYCNVLKGEEVLTLGYPLISLQGQEQKANFGRVNSLSGIQDDPRFIQIDVPVQPGNSGGPLINKRGEVVGVVSATLNQIVALRTSGTLHQNVNFAVKIDYILPTLRIALKNQQLAVPISTTAILEMTEIISLRESSVVLVVAK